MTSTDITTDIGVVPSEPAGIAWLVRTAWMRLRSSQGYGARLARGTIWTTIGMIAGQLSATAGAILAARILGANAFGQFGMLRSTVVLFGVLAGTGLSLSATKVVAEFRTTDPDRAGRALTMLLHAALLMSGVAMAIAIFGAHAIAGPLLHAPELVFGLRVASLLVFLNAVNGVQMGGLNGLEAFRVSSGLTAAEGVVTLCSVASGAWFWGLNGAIVGMVIGPLVLLPFKQFALVRECRRNGIQLHTKATRTELQMIWSDVVPAILIGVSSQPFEWFARVMLARQAGGYVEVGVFTAAFAWAQVVSLASSQLTNPAVPIMANVFAAGDRRAFLRLLRFVAMSTGAVTVLVVLPVVLFSGWIMRVYGHGFTSGAPVLRVIAVAYGFASISSLLRSALVATGKLWHQNMHALIWGCITVLTFLLLRSHGAMGLGLAYLVAYCVVIFTQGASVWTAIRHRVEVTS
jgi:O-antigen/teichoic acid export membrane protein